MPRLDSLEPAEAELGSAAFTLHCHGEGFSEDSIIIFAGQDEPTTLVSETEVTAVITPPTEGEATTVEVRVGGSEPLPFTFLAAEPPYTPPPDLLEELKKGNVAALEGATDEEMKTIKAEYEAWAEETAAAARKQAQATTAAIQGELGRRDLSPHG